MTDLNKNFLTKSSLSTLSGRDEWNERIDNVLRSVKGSHLFNRRFGYLDALLFSELSESTGHEILLSIDTILGEAIPEILLDRQASQCVPIYEEQLYVIQLFYTIITTGESNSYQNTTEVIN